MTGENVTEINPAGNLKDFLLKMFGSHNGYVYVHITAPDDASDWQPFHFKWPSGLDDIIAHVLKYRAEKEIYFSPVLFSKPDLRQENVKGTQFIWAEFNGETPDSSIMKDVPIPSMKIRTSMPGHEYWFWNIEFFSTDLDKIQDVLKRVAFHLKADLSAWHHESVLRLPNTVHHRTGLHTYLFETTDSVTSIQSFFQLPDPPKYLTEDSFKRVPDVNDVIFTYSFPVELRKFFKKSNPTDSETREGMFRALTKLAFDCAELGMDNGSIMAMLLNADDRWGHFKGRTEEHRRARFIGLINHVRIKKPLKTNAGFFKDVKVRRFGELLEMNIQMEWAIDDLIPKAGTGFIVGDSNVGKTRMSLSLFIHMALGRDFLIWKIPKPMKVMFISLEMNEPTLKRFLESMASAYTPEEIDLISENLFLWAPGQSNHMNNPKYHDETLDLIKEFRPEGILIDTFGVAVQDDLTNQKIVNEVFEFINAKVKKVSDCFVIFIHHNRKHGDEAPTRDDMFGSVYIANQTDAAIMLHCIKKDPTKGDIIKVINIKNRMAEYFAPFRMRSNRETLQYDLMTATGAKTTKVSEAKLISDDAKNEIEEGFGI